MTHRSARFTDKLRYRFDNYMAWSPSARFFLVFALGMTALLLGALLLKLFGPHAEPAASFGEALWWSWGRVADPGSGAGDEGRGVRTAEVITTLAGLFVFALLIGFVSNAIEEKLSDLRKGHSVVIERNHTLLLGFGDKALSVIEELAEANASLRDACIVVLTTQEKDDVIATLLERFGSPRVQTTRIVVRNGSPSSPSDLKKVAAQAARSIIVFAEDGNDTGGDVRVVKALLALLRGLDHPPAGHVVVELTDADHRDVIAAVGGDQVEAVLARNFLARLMVQTSRQTGLAQVYADLLGFRGDEFYLLPVPPMLVGRTFRDAWSALPTGVVTGWRPHDPEDPRARPNRKVVLAPPDSTVLGLGDQLLILLPDDSADLTPRLLRFNETLPVNSHAELPAQPERLLLLGFKADIGDTLLEFDSYVAAGSEATVLTSLPPEECAARLAEILSVLHQLTVRFVTGDPTNRADLARACDRPFDAALVLSDEVSATDPDDADARTLMSLLLLRHLEQTGHGVSTRRVVSEIRDPRTKHLAAIAQVGDFVVSDELVSHLLAQVSEHRDLADVWADLCDADGCEVYLKPAWRYANPGETVCFADLMARARLRGEVALGWKSTALEQDAAAHFGVTLNPPDKQRMFVLNEADRVIVIAEDAT